MIKQDLNRFTKYLGYENAPFQEDYLYFLQHKFSPLKEYPNRIKQAARFWPRGHAKSTITDFNYLSWIIGNNPNIHTNIVTKTASLSEEISLALMTRMESDEKYIDIFGELKPKNPRKWTTHEFIVERDEISKNPTVKATGIMGPITGGRSDLIICDDILDEENVRTHLQKKKLSTWFRKILLPTLYPWGAIIVIGTRYSYDDLYSEIIPEINPKTGLIIKKNWHPQVEVKKAIINEESQQVLWPEYWPYEKLIKRREQIGTIIFNCQYQNDPTDMEGDILKGEWLHPWETPPHPRCEYYAAIDPSMGEYDYFGIAIGAYDRALNKPYLVDVIVEHAPLVDILKHKIPLLRNQYRFVKVYFEKNFWQKLLLNVPELKALPIVPIVTVRDKTSRFITMSSHFESKRIEVNPLLLMKSEFFVEWIQYPHGQHDDGLDCVEMLVTNMIKQESRQPVFKLI